MKTWTKVFLDYFKETIFCSFKSEKLLKKKTKKIDDYAKHYTSTIINNIEEHLTI